MTRLLVVSNGLGEDAIGAAIVARLPPQFETDAYPTLGPGRAYDGVCPLAGPRAALVSEGSRLSRFSVLRDVLAGGLATIPPGLAFLRAARLRYDRVLVVGDFVGVAGCWLAGLGGIVWLDVYRTGFGRPYLAPERWIAARAVRTAFCRHESLAASLRQAGIAAHAAGNVMMDAIPRAGYDAMARRTRPLAVTLLPGSREATAENLALQARALALLPMAVDAFLAVAPGIDPARLAARLGGSFEPGSGVAGDLGRIVMGSLVLHAAAGALGELVEASDVVLSEAGTATVQALGLGRPVIQMRRDTGRSRRTEAESRLFGAARLLVPARPEALAEALGQLLADPAERARLGAIGVERIGPPGAMAAVIRALA